jgi:serine/threonine protein kinase/serine/threonine protein phosphatase PrpC
VKKERAVTKFAASQVGSKRLRVVTGFWSEQGARPTNDDYVGAFATHDIDRIVIAAVADGVGGAQGGRVAAELSVRGFIEGCLDKTRASIKEAGMGGLDAMNRWLQSIGRDDIKLRGMACTFTGLVAVGRQAHAFHVGDSRLYRLRGDSFEQLTVDHSAGPGLSHVLTRAVGAEESLRVDYAAFENEPHDRYLLCTDGVHGGLSQRRLRDLLGGRASPQETAREIVRHALATRVGDNATALVVDIVDLPAADDADVARTFANLTIGPLPALGAMIDGFRIETILSGGRYMRVVHAIDRDAGRDVVLKFPKPLAGAEASMRESFQREVWISSRVHSPFVGEVLRLGADRQTQLYLGLPFYQGEALESRIKRQPHLSLTAGLDIAQKLAKGVAALHRAGVIHRDIKPENVIIEAPARNKGTGVKLIDFGVACRQSKPETSGTTQPGTPSYMAPELFDGTPADERSDQFALGVTVYRLFTGRFPYGEIEPFSHPKFAAPAAFSNHRPDLPAWLDKTIARAIAVNAQERYDDVLEFMFELEHGAERAAPIEVLRKPLYHRNPLAFWKAVSALLALLLLGLLLWPRLTLNQPDNKYDPMLQDIPVKRR